MDAPAQHLNGLGPLNQCIAIDLEVSPKHANLLAIAAYRQDSKLQYSAKGPLEPHKRLRLEQTAAGARFLLGHNITDFDLPHLQVLIPDSPILELPVIDTLRLNPLAFPKHPYHRLVKQTAAYGNLLQDEPGQVKTDNPDRANSQRRQAWQSSSPPRGYPTTWSRS